MFVLDQRLRRALRPVRLACLASVLSIHASAQTSAAQTLPAQTPPVQNPPAETPAAQTPAGDDEPLRSSRRPFRGLFHVGGQAPGREQSLILTASTYGGYDDNVINDQPGGSATPGAQVGGGILGTEADLLYTKNNGRMAFTSSLDGAIRYVPNRSSLTAASYGAGAGLSYQLARRTHVQVGQNVGVQPYYQFGPFAGFPDESLGSVVPSNLDFTVLKRSSVLIGTEASLDQQLSRRSTMTLGYEFYDQRFDRNTSQGSVPDLRSQSGSIRFNRSLSRYMGIHVGYEYRHITDPSGGALNLDGHNIDAGIDYTRTLAFTRRTAFSFSTGSTIFKVARQTFYGATAHANLSHRFDRRGTWEGRLAYNRDVTFVASFRAPFFGDAITAELQGIVGRRLQISMTGGYLKGQLGLVTQSADLHTGTAGISTTYALNDFLGVTLDYTYYTYDFSSVSVPELPTGFRPRLSRNSVRAGLTLRLPLLLSEGARQ